MSTETGLVKQSTQVSQFNFFDPIQFETMQRTAMVFASSELVPDMYKISSTNPREKAIANNILALEIASRIGASPLMVMQNLYIVYGKPGWSSKFLTATVNTCGRFQPIQYKETLLGNIIFNGVQIENWQCIAFTSANGSDKILESTPVNIKMAIDEGWYGKKGSKWPTMPKKMLRYRSVSFWTNEYAPELSMGMKTADEIADYIPFEVVPAREQQENKPKANGTNIGFDSQPPANGNGSDLKQNDDKQAQPAVEQQKEGGPDF